MINILLKSIKVFLIFLCIIFLVITLFYPRKEIHIAFSSDNTYAIGLGITIMSILQNAKYDEKLYFYVLEKNISAANKKKIAQLQKYHPFEIKYFDMNQYIKNHLGIPSYLNSPTYYRYFLADIFPNLSKILYLDSDLLVVSSLSDLWETDITNKYAAVVEDMHSFLHSFQGITRLFNAGVMLINLNEWRKNDFKTELIKTDTYMRQTQQYEQKDQTVLNKLFKENVVWLSPANNFFHTCPVRQIYQNECVQNQNNYSAKEIEEARLNPTVIHFIIEGKPWINGPNSVNANKWYRLIWESPWHGIWVVDNSTPKHDAKLLITENNKQYYFRNIPSQKGILTIIKHTATIQWNDGHTEEFNILFKNGFPILHKK